MGSCCRDEIVEMLSYWCVDVGIREKSGEALDVLEDQLRITSRVS